MAKIYLDHNIPLLVARALNERGHDAVPARDFHHNRAPDYEILAEATRERRTLVTHNANDFRLLHGAWMLWSNNWNVPAEHAGILIVQADLNLDVRAIANCLEEFFQQYSLPTNELHHYGTHGWKQIV